MNLLEDILITILYGLIGIVALLALLGIPIILIPLFYYYPYIAFPAVILYLAFLIGAVLRDLIRLG